MHYRRAFYALQGNGETSQTVKLDAQRDPRSQLHAADPPGSNRLAKMHPGRSGEGTVRPRWRRQGPAIHARPGRQARQAGKRRPYPLPREPYVLRWLATDHWAAWSPGVVEFLQREPSTTLLALHLSALRKHTTTDSTRADTPAGKPAAMAPAPRGLAPPPSSWSDLDDDDGWQGA